MDFSPVVFFGVVGNGGLLPLTSFPGGNFVLLFPFLCEKELVTFPLVSLEWYSGAAGPSYFFPFQSWQGSVFERADFLVFQKNLFVEKP